ncbi:GDP-mannose 4,6-dehydratase [Alphaproteobacteria bacterium]|nr:GDP-mannose 4,6-dehydratase [Alphaproteobacteria bacterium]MDB2324436.1 GDP-mannose 4,6-dehydratase [Alphaproteobacteria bacterium]
MNQDLNLNNKKIFVTGADGFIGSHLVKKLVVLGADVRALCYYNSNGHIGYLSDVEPAILSNVEIVFGDVRDRSLIQHQILGYDYIFHLASLISIPHSYVAGQSYLDVNVGGLLNILESLKSQSFTRLINTSTSEVYGSALTRPINEGHPLQGQSPYSASKIAADHFIEAYHRSFEMPLCILRPFNTYGPRQSIRAVIPTIISQLIDPNIEELKLGDLTPLRDFNYVANTVDAFVAMMFSEGVKYGEAYNAGSGQSISIKDTLGLIEKSVGKKKPITVDNNKKRPEKSEVLELIADSSKFNNATGWTPQVNLEDGLKLTVDWFQKNLAQNGRGASSILFD